MNVNNSNQTYLTNNNDIYPYKVGIPVLCTIAFLSLLLNCTILISAKWIRHKMSPNLRLSVSLAAADALTSALFIVGLIVNSYLPIVCGWPLAYLDCFRLFLETLRLGAVITSVLHLLLLSVNQLIGIVQPLRYRRIISTRVVTVALLGVWLLPTACLNIFFALLSAGGYSAPNCRTEFVVTFSFRICVFLSVLIPFVLVLLIYVLVVVLLKRIHSCYAHQQLSPPQQVKKNVRAATTTLLIVGTFALGWLPGALLFVLVCQDCMFDVFTVNRAILVPAATAINIFIIVKLMANPFVYACRIVELRYALWLMHKSSFGLKGEPDFYHCDIPQEFLRINTNAAVILNSRASISSSPFSASLRQFNRNSSDKLGDSRRLRRCGNELIRIGGFDISKDVIL